MSEEQQAWYYMVDGEQVGPITGDELQQYAAGGFIHPETEVWTEGLDQWVPATHVEGLAFGQPAPAEPTGPKLILGAAAQAAHPLAGEGTPQPAQPLAAAPVQPMAAPAVAAAPAGYQQPGMQPGLQPTAVPGYGMQAAVQPGTDYPATGTKRASYGLLIGTLLGGILMIIIGIIIAVSAGSGVEEMSDEKAAAGGLALFACVGIGYLLMLISGIVSYIYLYRAWNCLRFGAPRTTPGKAIGFLFIPFFNIYWMFVAIYGLPQDWNRIVASYPNLQGAPRMSEGMFLTMLICNLVFPPVGLIMWFIVYKQMCDGINYMAARDMAAQRPAGMSFY